VASLSSPPPSRVPTSATSLRLQAHIEAINEASCLYKLHTCTHAHMHTCTHAHMHTCTHAHTHIYTHTQSTQNTHTPTHHTTNTQHKHTPTPTPDPLSCGWKLCYLLLNQWSTAEPPVRRRTHVGYAFSCIAVDAAIMTSHPCSATPRGTVPPGGGQGCLQPTFGITLMG
jgi:hypothetical protein